MAVLTDADLAMRMIHSYHGIARVPLHSLNFEHRLARDQHRELSLDNVRRLESIYEKNGCLRLQEENVINAIIDDDTLTGALAKTSVSADSFRSHRWAQEAPYLHLTNVRCLSGLHRTKAADRFLDANDKWWIVRLFSSKTPEKILTRLIESYSHEQRPTDGEIFRKIRFYHRQQDQVAEDRWWACLDKSKPRDLRQLLKRPKLISAFDRLIDMPGLWQGVQIGALHRLLVLKCEEEMVSYLNHISEFWTNILQCGNASVSPSCVDVATVELLEFRAPRHSASDKDLVTELMRKDELFPTIADEEIRMTIRNNIQTLRGMVPSLRSFFEMLKYIEPICAALRHLIGDGMRGTIRKSLLGNYWAPPKVMVLSSDLHEVELITPIAKDDAARVAYFELWAFCARHFDYLTTFTPRKETRGMKPACKGPNPVVWKLFAELAISRGFKLPHAHDLANGEPVSQLALEYLEKANPITACFTDSDVQSIVHATICRVKGRNIDNANDLPFVNTEKERRIGRPFERDLIEDKEKLFFPSLFKQRSQDHMSLTVARRLLLCCILGEFNPQDYEFSEPKPMKPSHNPPEHMDIDDASHMPSSHDNAQHDKIEEILRKNDDLQKSKNDLQLRYGSIETEHAALKQRHQELDQENKSLKRRCIELEQENGDKEIEDVERVNDNDQDLRAQYNVLLQQYEALQRTNALQAIQKTSQTTIGTDATEAFIKSLLQNASAHRRQRVTFGEEYELFVACSNEADGQVKGCRFGFKPDDPDALTFIKDIISAVMKYLPAPVKALTVPGKTLNMIPDFLFQYLKAVDKIVLLGSQDVLDRYVMSRMNERGLKTIKNSSLVRPMHRKTQTQPHSLVKPTKRRRLTMGQEDSGGRPDRNTENGDTNEDEDMDENEDEEL